MFATLECPEEGRYDWDHSFSTPDEDDEELRECAGCGEEFYPDFDTPIEIDGHRYHDDACRSLALHKECDQHGKANLGRLLAACQVLAATNLDTIPLEQFEIDTLWLTKEDGKRTVVSLGEFRQVAQLIHDTLAPKGLAPSWTEPVTIAADDFVSVAGKQATL